MHASVSGRPVIGIPTQNLQSIGGMPSSLPASWVMSHRYILALTNEGAVPWLIPLVDTDTLRGIYERLDGIFLPGGADIDPSTYGTETHALCDKTDPERDRVEISLARWAIEDGTPLLGVCRGMQLINVAAGGTLYQDLAAQLSGSIKHDYFPFGEQHYARDHLAHEVHVESHTRLARLFGAGTLRVNSMHHQGIKELGAGLVATASSPDGLIEAIEGKNGNYLVAVQWHPEALVDADEKVRILFSDFISQAAKPSS